MAFDPRSLLSELKDIYVLEQGQPIIFRNDNPQDMFQNVSRLQSDGLKPLATLFPADASGVVFAEFWEECSLLEYQSKKVRLFGYSHYGLFVIFEDGVVGSLYLSESRTKIIGSIICNQDISQFAICFSIFQSMLQLLRAERLVVGQIEFMNRTSLIEDCKDRLRHVIGDPLFSIESYWANLIDMVDQGEYPIYKDLLYYQSRS